MKIIMKKIIKEPIKPTIIPEPEEQEIWKEVPVDNGHKYRVSSFGNVEKFLSGKWQPQKLSKSTRQNYLVFGLNGKVVKVHQLICTIFNGSAPSGKHTPDHIDLCEYNNYYKNLEWITPSEQILRGTSGGKAKGKRKIAQFELDGTFKQIHESLKAAAKSVGRNYHGGIYHSCNSNRSYLGYHWAYLDVCEIIKN